MTNQASEDDERLVNEFVDRWYLSEDGDSESLKLSSKLEMKRQMLAIIRTEKLKLLEAIKSEWEKFGEGTNISDGEYAFLDIIEQLEAEL